MLTVSVFGQSHSVSRSSKTKTSGTSVKSKSNTNVPSKQQIINKLISNMVYVPYGTFTMGATGEQGYDANNDEKPLHYVTLSNYFIGRFEVTQEEWEAVMGSNPSEFKGPKHPVENVSWEDCQEFIRRLNNITGKHFRLPTESEWEYAARGGRSGGHKYANSNEINSVGWYIGNSKKTTHAVGQKRPNDLGLYDMSGNVWEWCGDWYGNYYSSEQRDPKGPNSSSDRVIRGGSWCSDASDCRISKRCSFLPTSQDIDLGFRLAL